MANSVQSLIYKHYKTKAEASAAAVKVRKAGYWVKVAEFTLPKHHWGLFVANK